MKKQLLTFYFVFAITLCFGFNADYGLSVDSFVGSDMTEGFGFEKVSIYSSLAFTDSISLAIDGFYKFSYPGDDTHIIDMSTLSFIFPIGFVNMQVGRGFMGDYSGDILSHTLDGFTSIFNIGSITMVVNAGYSGLINKNEVLLLETVQDSEDDFRKKIVEGFDIVKAFRAITLWGSIYSVQDINSLNTNLPIYIGSGVQGSIGNDIYYSLRGNFNSGLFHYLDSETGEEEQSLILAGMGALTVDWFLRSEKVKFLSPLLTLNAGVSSGDSTISSAGLGQVHSKDISDGVNIYVPISSSGPGSIYSTTNQNLTYVKLAASITPLKSFQAEIGSTVFLRTIEGVTGDDTINSDASGNYLGTEISSTINYRPFSDLGFSLSGGVFIPDGTINSNSTEGLISLYVSLSI